MSACPLSGVKRTSRGLVAMSACDPKWIMTGLNLNSHPALYSVLV
jgi:hypothetical protein